MKFRLVAIAVAFCSTLGADRGLSIEKAAAKFVPGVQWRPESVVSGDFTCRGRREQAILGAGQDDVVIAVFLNGRSSQPEVLRDSLRNRISAQLITEDLDYEPTEIPGYALPGFRRSKRCLGLGLDDQMVDPAHIYWNHDAHRFSFWSN
jgi:hypothetical protein